jgi:hypothetical protein
VKRRSAFPAYLWEVLSEGLQCISKRKKCHTAALEYDANSFLLGTRLAYLWVVLYEGLQCSCHLGRYRLFVDAQPARDMDGQPLGCNSSSSSSSSRW